MAMHTANLLITCAAWEGCRNALADAIIKEADKYWVNAVNAPLRTLELTNDAKQRAVLREFADWDDVKDTRPLTVIAANPYSPEALENFSVLCDALKLRVERLKYAACDDDTALAFSEILKFVGIDRVEPREIMVPVTPGSGSELAKKIAEKSEESELCVVLEEVDEPGLVAKRLLTENQRVVRMPIFTGGKNQLNNIPDNDLPCYILVVDPISVVTAIQGMRRAAVDTSQITWVGTNPSLKKLAQRDAPGSGWLEVSDLRHDAILDRVSKDG